ncbi:MAG: Hpt domain-containing protein [Erysipelotrichaceae bacterium]|nr:Hpt domain-containing protein [Erysipelotrichaceae bacterium]
MKENTEVQEVLSIEKLKEYGADVKTGLNLCMNMEDFYLRMVSMVVKEQSFADLERAIGENDLEAAFRAAHALKGVTGNLSLTPLYDKVAQITELLRAHTPMDYSGMLEGILNEKKTLESMIND